MEFLHKIKGIFTSKKEKNEGFTSYVDIKKVEGGTEYVIPGKLYSYGFVDVVNGKDGKEIEIHLKMDDYQQGDHKEYQVQDLIIVSNKVDFDKSICYCDLNEVGHVKIFVPDDAKFFCSGSKSCFVNKNNVKTYHCEIRKEIDATRFGKMISSLGTNKFFDSFPAHSAFVVPLEYKKDLELGTDEYGMEYILLKNKDKNEVIVNYTDLLEEGNNLHIQPSIFQGDWKVSYQFNKEIKDWLEKEKEN